MDDLIQQIANAVPQPDFTFQGGIQIYDLTPFVWIILAIGVCAYLTKRK